MPHPSRESSISTFALRQKLRIGQTSTLDHNQALGMGLAIKLRARDPIFKNKVKSILHEQLSPWGWIATLTFYQ